MGGMRVLASALRLPSPAGRRAARQAGRVHAARLPQRPPGPGAGVWVWVYVCVGADVCVWPRPCGRVGVRNVRTRLSPPPGLRRRPSPLAPPSPFKPQAESVAALLTARTPAAADSALAGLRGGVGGAVAGLRAECLSLLAELEARWGGWRGGAGRRGGGQEKRLSRPQAMKCGGRPRQASGSGASAGEQGTGTGGPGRRGRNAQGPRVHS